MQALIPLALEGTDVGKVKAAHGLAKIAAVSNPDIAFPGERVGIREERERVMKIIALRVLSLISSAKNGLWCCHREDNDSDTWTPGLALPLVSMIVPPETQLSHLHSERKQPNLSGSQIKPDRV